MTDKFQSVSEAIRNRRTLKVIADQEGVSNSGNTDHALIDRLVETAGWAPFHQPSHNAHRIGDDRVVEPWRVYKLDANGCREMIRCIDANDNAGIIPGMLGAADALLNVTWLPDPDPSYTAPEFSPTERNMEHIAAASAFIQNFLIAATAEGITTYWSSGGIFNQPKYKKMVGIPEQEILLGAVFVFPQNTDGCELREGKLRVRRSDVNAWSRWVNSKTS